MILRQILLTGSIRTVWRTVRRICIFISGLKGLSKTIQASEWNQNKESNFLSLSRKRLKRNQHFINSHLFQIPLSELLNTGHSEDHLIKDNEFQKRRNSYEGHVEWHRNKTDL